MQWKKIRIFIGMDLFASGAILKLCFRHSIVEFETKLINMVS